MRWQPPTTDAPARTHKESFLLLAYRWGQLHPGHYAFRKGRQQMGPVRASHGLNGFAMTAGQHHRYRNEGDDP